MIGDDSPDFQREWLSVNGRGGFASGTVAGAATRRYHAYLIATLPPPHGRMALLGKVEETVTVGDQAVSLATNQYANNVVHPDGWRRIADFTAWPVPTWQFALPNGGKLTKCVFFALDKNTLHVTYTFTKDSDLPITLTLAPLVCWKSYHAEMRSWPGFPSEQNQTPNGWQLRATPDAPLLQLLLPDADWQVADWWNRDIVHQQEQQRGFADCTEDLYCPATATCTLLPGQTAVLTATIDEEPFRHTAAAAADALAQIKAYPAALSPTVPLAVPRPKSTADQRMILSADQFLIRDLNHQATVIAGYPWFTDWGRDTMIALPGLCFATGRLDHAREILGRWSEAVQDGLLPNRFPDDNAAPEYHTADATLWFLHTLDRYINRARDHTFQSDMRLVRESILDAHIRGTRHHIQMDPTDCLLQAGDETTNLTWMDARVNNIPVTPRAGKPVEINALWVNALRNGGERYTNLAERAAVSFGEKFVRPDGNGLWDVLPIQGAPDPAIRPNMVIAAAVSPDLLSDDTARLVLQVATEKLWTPCGLRTLAPDDPRYCGRYGGGGPNERDAAYHQGTVWPWLIGAFVDLYRRVHGADAAVSPLLKTLENSLGDYGVGGVAEIYDGDAPHLPNGCPWQAWSIAEVLRSEAD